MQPSEKLKKESAKSRERRSMIKLRLTGTPYELERITSDFKKKGIHIMAESKLYKNRDGKEYRKYLNISVNNVAL